VGLERILRWSGRQVGIVLLYHRVGDPPGDRDREISPALGAALFEAQLEHLKAYYDVVAASEMLAAVRKRRRGQRFPVALTFDDDLRSHLRVAAPILKRAGVGASFFLSGASLERPYAFWWEDLQCAIDEKAVPPELLSVIPSSELEAALSREPHAIHRVARQIEQLSQDSRAWVADTLRATRPGTEGGLSAAEVRSLADDGWEIGFHTLRHDPLPGLSDESLERALREGRAELEAAVGADVRLISYPHGQADGRVAAAAGRAGFRSGFRGGGAPVRLGTDPLAIPRIDASFRSAERFALQLVKAVTGSVDADRSGGRAASARDRQREGQAEK
jgi:peptidoglycan/xylan/chitin deacetylase (PgdA/CDA1 family)